MGTQRTGLERLCASPGKEPRLGHRRVIGGAAADPNRRASGGRVTTREVQQGCRWLKESGAAEAALEELVMAGRGAWNSELASASGGHSRRVYVLSTPPTSTLAQKLRESEASVDVDSVDAREVVAPASDGPASLFGEQTMAGPYRDGF